ncbi:hypothetical protein [Clostridium porci]|uniref:Uncharacterized protein n=1 Tax=Clostridium porci TaxID=2605778 RepID=A0A7X2NLG2_9CLOT|nr:hypothetical protein [Clostridium porci]MSS37017.1 hypothetical protein [Clostridium porci]
MYCFSRYLCNRYVRKKIVGKINPFWIAVGSMRIAALFMIILTSASNTIMAFAILQGMTMVSEEVIESQYIKVIDKNDISSVLSFMSALRSILTTVVLFIISKTITDDNMSSFFKYTVIAYLIIVISLLNWKKRFGGER